MKFYLIPLSIFSSSRRKCVLLLSALRLIAVAALAQQTASLALVQDASNGKPSESKTEYDTDSPTPNAFTFGAKIQGDIVQNFHGGGVKTGSDYIGLVHLTVSFDTKKVGPRKGGELFFNGVNAHGGTPFTTLIGDFQPISRNETPKRTALFQF